MLGGRRSNKGDLKGFGLAIISYAEACIGSGSASHREQRPAAAGAEIAAQVNTFSRHNPEVTFSAETSRPTRDDSAPPRS
jgi:hypothetical protein